MEKSSPSPSPHHPHQMAYIAELRKESSPTAITFSDPCPCCGNKKRRCLLPSPPPSRKKLLVVDLSAAATSPTPLPSPPPSLTSPPSVTQISDFIARRTPPTLQDSSSFTRRRSVTTSTPAVMPPAAVTAPSAAVTAPSAAIAPAISQQAEIRVSGFFNWRRSDTTSPALQDSGSFKVRRSDPTSPAVSTPAAVISPAAKKEQAEVIGPQGACEYDGGERSNWSASSLAQLVECSAENDKRGREGEEEFRVGLKCKCGVVREFVLTG